MAIKQHSFKLDTENADEKAINDFLQGKPTTYIIIEAMKLYIRTEKAKHATIENMLANMQSGFFTQPTEQAPQTTKSKKDEIEEFEL